MDQAGSLFKGHLAAEFHFCRLGLAMCMTCSHATTAGTSALGNCYAPSVCFGILSTRNASSVYNAPRIGDILSTPLILLIKFIDPLKVLT